MGGMGMNQLTAAAARGHAQMMLFKNQAMLTGLGACLFLAGLVLLFVVLFHEAMRGGALPWITAVLLVAAGACWAASARAGKFGQP
jgi:hypothetical protein